MSLLEIKTCQKTDFDDLEVLKDISLTVEKERSFPLLSGPPVPENPRCFVVRPVWKPG